MTNAWRFDKCKQFFGSKKNRISLKMECELASGKCEYLDYADLCFDCELVVKENWRNTMMILADLLIARRSENRVGGKRSIPMLFLEHNVQEQITRFVRVCPIFYPLKRQVLSLCYYIKKHSLIPLYRLLMCMYSTKSTHIIIIISTKVQYSIVSVLTQYKSVI
jgi:hypothetical protein